MEDISDILKALGDPTRLRIVEMLAGRELCVCEIQERLELSQPLASHHLRELKRAGLVLARREGVWNYYRLDSKRIATVREGLGSLLSAAVPVEPGTCCSRPRQKGVSQ
jgi:ArsR family transcriptional regulator